MSIHNSIILDARPGTLCSVEFDSAEKHVRIHDHSPASIFAAGSTSSARSLISPIKA